MRKEEIQLVKLLDVLAAVHLRKHGVIAVTSLPYDGSGNVEVILSPYFPSREPLKISQSSSVIKPVKNLLQSIFISQNPRSETDRTKIIDPEEMIPSSFKSNMSKSPAGLELLRIFLLREW